MHTKSVQKPLRHNVHKPLRLHVQKVIGLRVQKLVRHHIAKLEAEYQQTLADRQQTHEQIRTKDARRATIIAVYRQLADQPIKHFQSSQWTALIDHAVVDEGEIRFVFRTGAEIIVEL